MSGGTFGLICVEKGAAGAYGGEAGLRCDARDVLVSASKIDRK